MQEELLTIKEVAQILRVSAATVYGYIHSELLSAIKFARDYRIYKEDLDKFIEQHKFIKN